MRGLASHATIGGGPGRQFAQIASWLLQSCGSNQEGIRMLNPVQYYGNFSSHELPSGNSGPGPPNHAKPFQKMKGKPVSQGACTKKFPGLFYW